MSANLLLSLGCKFSVCVTHLIRKYNIPKVKEKPSYHTHSTMFAGVSRIGSALLNFESSWNVKSRPQIHRQLHVCYDFNHLVEGSAKHQSVPFECFGDFQDKVIVISPLEQNIYCRFSLTQQGCKLSQTCHRRSKVI